jgi:tetratricopeptide (TPR) repeat protein
MGPMSDSENENDARSLLRKAMEARRSGRLLGAAAAYRQAIEAARACNCRDVLAIANDNLGNVLADLGDFDAALSSFDASLSCETHPRGISIVVSNKARVLGQLGYLRESARVLLDRGRALEMSGGTPLDIGVALDNVADAYFRLGDYTQARTMFERAAVILAGSDPEVRALNSIGLSTVCGALGDTTAAANAFRSAYDLSFDVAHRKVNIQHYRDGFLAALRKRLPPASPPWRAFFVGIQEKSSGKWKEALATWAQAERVAREQDDVSLSLQVRANIAAILADQGQLSACIPLVNQVRDEASSLGLAKPELLATGTLGSVMMSGADVSDPAGVLGLFAHVVALGDAHHQVVNELPLTPEAKTFETQDSGAALTQVSKLALDHHAYDIAVDYAKRAVEIARRNFQTVARQEEKGQTKPEIPFEIPNRLSGLIAAAQSAGRPEIVDDAARDLEGLLDEGKMTLPGQLIAHRTLGSHKADLQPAAAIYHFRAACEISETLREQIPLGSGRANIALQHRDIFGRLTRLLAGQNDPEGAFEALQGMKDRHLLEAAAARANAGSDRPPRVDEAMAIVGELGKKGQTFLVDLFAEDQYLTAFIVDSERVRSVRLPADVQQLAEADKGDLTERPGSVVKCCLDNSDMANFVKAISEQIPGNCRVLLSTDGFLGNLPLHIVPINGEPWCDYHKISYLSGIGPLKYMDGTFESNGVATIAGDSRSDLPGAAAECKSIAKLLGSKPFIGGDCTMAAVVGRLNSARHLLLHLALHGRGDSRHGQRGSLLFAGGAHGAEWVDSRRLFSPNAAVDLVVLSGCSTAVTGPLHGYELVSLVRNAIEAGASSVVACLWPVEDVAAKIFMKAFYRNIVEQLPGGTVDLVSALDAARTALRSNLETAPELPRGHRRNGRNFTLAEVPNEEERRDVFNALTWAPFMLFGQPVLRAR